MSRVCAAREYKKEGQTKMSLAVEEKGEEAYYAEDYGAQLRDLDERNRKMEEQENQLRQQQSRYQDLLDAR